MGATYTRQSSYTDGDVIQAADTNNEFDQLLAAFASSSGHTHDGGTGEGGPITKMLGTSLTLGDGSDSDITVTFNTNANDGTYDLFWYLHNGKKVRVEVKTSGRTVSKGIPRGWQHENVYFCDNKWDKLVFVDYDVDDSVCFTILNYDDVVKEDSLDLRVLDMGYGHVRKNEQGKAKVDTRMKQRNAGIANGVTFRYNYNNPQDELLGLFLINKLSN